MLSEIEEGCCSEILNKFNSLNFDELNSREFGNFSRCDYVIDCSEKYIFIEEKSFIQAFIREMDSNIYQNDFDLKKVFEKLKELREKNEDKFNYLMCNSILNLTATSNNKLKDTILILSKQNDIKKIQNSSMIYLYCLFKDKNNPINRLFNIVINNRLRKLKRFLIPCHELEKELIKLGAK